MHQDTTGSRQTAERDVEQWNDRFAREHDINDYYARSGWAIQLIEQRRLAHIRRLLDARPGHRVLEVGCGGGHVLRQFPECDLTGVDVSGEMLAKAEKNLEGYRFTLHKGEIGKLGLEDGSFDRIICTEVLEHVVDPEPVLEHIARLLRPNGRAVITFPNDRLINGLKDAVRKARLDRLPPFRRVSWGGDHYHFHVWSVAEMRELLGRHMRVAGEAFAPSRLFPVRCCFACVPK